MYNGGYQNRSQEKGTELKGVTNRLAFNLAHLFADELDERRFVVAKCRTRPFQKSAPVFERKRLPPRLRRLGQCDHASSLLHGGALHAADFRTLETHILHDWRVTRRPVGEDSPLRG